MSNYFAGLDWASRTHAVCVIDPQGSVCERLEVAHDAAGLAHLVRRLKRWGSPPIAIERPSGLLVDTREPRDWAEVIARLLDDPQGLARMSDSSRDHAESWIAFQSEIAWRTLSRRVTET